MSKVLRVGLLSKVQNLDPRKAQDFVSAMVVSQIFEPPYAQPASADEAPAPLVFSEPLTSETGSEGEMVFSAPVRPGLKFSDGTPVTADLVVDSMRKAPPLVELATVEARDNRVVFHLKSPNARFDLFLAQTLCGVVLEKGGELLGTGPFVPAPNATPERMRLIRNPHFRSETHLDEMLFTYYPPAADGTAQTLLDAFDRDEVDFSNVLHREDVAKLKEVRKHFEPGNSTAMLYINTERPSLNDARVRKAIGLAIDRLELTQISYKNALAFTGRSLLPPMMGRWRDGLMPNLEEARSLLEQAGTARPETLSLLLIFGPRPYLPHPRPVAEYIVQRLGDLGIPVEIVETEGSVDYYKQIAAGEYDLALTGWIADTADPADFLEATLSTVAIPSPDVPISIHANLSRWRNAEVQELLVRYRQDPSEEIQEAILTQVSEKVPLVPLMYGSAIYVHSWRVREFKPTPLGIPDFAEIDIRE